MKRLLLVISLLIGNTAYAQARPLPDLWEKAAYGTVPGVTFVHLTGRNGTPTTTFEAAWEESAAYTPLLVAMSTPYCASSSANDTAAGTGARTIRVSGINTSFARFTETVTLNGQSSVNLTTTNVQFIDKIEVLTAGSGLVNAGIIQCGTGANTGGDPAVTHAYLSASSTSTITADGNVSEMFFYAVPANYSLVCKNFVVSTAMATAANNMTIAIDTYTNNDLLKRIPIALGEAGGGNPAFSPQIVKFAEKTILVGQVSGASGAMIQLSADCLLIVNESTNNSQNLF